MVEPDPIVKEFLVESYENLDQLDRDLVALEQDPRDRARLGSVFRTIHTIKGTCGFFGFGKLEAVAHVGENLLCRLRDGELLLDPEITTGLLALVDAVRGILARIEAAGEEGDGDYGGLIATLTRLAATTTSAPPAPRPVE
ncbi:MAG: CheA signal transduction histidine kinase, partial [Gemmataceae bacterium]|nr:CheA signal transduction histidine kinase [Gemmataceae bacterium]